MRRIHLGTLLAATLLTTSATWAADTPPPLPGNDPDAKVCKRVTNTGSLIAKRECRTRAEWEQMAKDARDATSRVRRGASGDSGE